LSLRRQLATEEADNSRVRYELATSLKNRGLLYYEGKPGGQLRQAQAYFEEAVAIDRNLNARFPSIPEYLVSLTEDSFNLARAQTDSKEFDKALLSLKEMVDASSKLLHSSPLNSDYRNRYVVTVRVYINWCSSHSRVHDAKAFIEGQKNAWRKRAADESENVVPRDLPSELDRLMKAQR
jgi:tetratricopeptide (TPR) repeat protein